MISNLVYMRGLLMPYIVTWVSRSREKLPGQNSRVRRMWWHFPIYILDLLHVFLLWFSVYYLFSGLLILRLDSLSGFYSLLCKIICGLIYVWSLLLSPQHKGSGASLGSTRSGGSVTFTIEICVNLMYQC